MKFPGREQIWSKISGSPMACMSEREKAMVEK